MALSATELLARQYRWNAAIFRMSLDTVLGDLSEDELNWQPRPGHHSIWHNVWHMFLSNDFYFADAFQVQPAWEAGGWQRKLDLQPMARAFDYPGNAAGGVVPRFVIADVPDDLVNELKALPLADYMAYVDDLTARTQQVLAGATDKQIRRRVPWYGNEAPAWSMVSFGHASRHLGMIEDLKGLMRGPGAGSASI